MFTLSWVFVLHNFCSLPNLLYLPETYKVKQTRKIAKLIERVRLILNFKNPHPSTPVLLQRGQN